VSGNAHRVVLDVDTGTDDAGALLLAASHPAFALEAALATWGNCSRTQVARNTQLVLEAAHSTAPVHLGTAGPCGPAPFTAPADEVMGGDGLAGHSQSRARAQPTGTIDPEPAAAALVRRAREAPGLLTVVALAPLTTLAAALALDPDLPSQLAGLIVMGGAIAVGGNVTPAAESNMAHDPLAATQVVEAFGAPGALGHGAVPRLVPLDVTRPSALTRAELDALRASSIPGAALVHQIFAAAWPTGLLETGRPDVWPAHDLLATWCVHQPEVCRWEVMPLAVDVGGDVAWGATVADRSLPRKTLWDHRPEAPVEPKATAGIAANRWEIAMDLDVERYHAGVRAWLATAPQSTAPQSTAPQSPNRLIYGRDHATGRSNERVSP
jgi:purine nucleosidase